MVDNIEALVELAALKVAEDMARKPPSGADGIWRFDRIIDDVFGRNRSCTKQFWIDVQNAAYVKNARRDTWDRAGFGVVASYAGTKAAYATPGFAEARSKYMT